MPKSTDFIGKYTLDTGNPVTNITLQFAINSLDLPDGNEIDLRDFLREQVYQAFMEQVWPLATNEAEFVEWAQKQYPDFSDAGPYATADDATTAAELGQTIQELREDRHYDDVHAPALATT